MIRITLAAVTLLFALATETRAEVALSQDLRSRLAGLPTLNGRPFDPKQGPVTLVTFFASWCPPCREEFRHLNRLRSETSEDDLDIVAINILEDWNGLSDAAKLRRFLKKTKPTFVTLKGNDAIAKVFDDVTRLPTVFVFDRAGQQKMHFVHKYQAKKMSLTYDELAAAVRPLF